MIGRVPAFEKMTIYLDLLRGPAVKKNPSVFLMHGLWSRVKFCAVEMRNAIIRNDLKTDEHW